MIESLASRLDAIYARLPSITCQRKCAESCGPLLVSPAEWENMALVAGRSPAARRDDWEAMRCPLLDASTGSCTIYSSRPIVCRLFGLVHDMDCPHGCVPDRWVTTDEAFALLTEIEALLPGAVRCTYPLELLGAMLSRERPTGGWEPVIPS